MNYKTLNVASLINKCISRDPIAWAEFITRYSPLISLSVKSALSKYCSGMVTSEEVKDIEQNIMISLWHKNKLDEVKNKENINYWLAITSRNATVNYLKTKQKEILIGEEDYFEKFTLKKAGQIENEGYAEKIKKIYNFLTPREKIMFKLYFRKKLNLKDISTVMHLPLGTVSARITRMRKKICSKF